MDARALALVGIVAAGLAWWRGRDAAELGAELEDLAGMTPQASELAELALEPNVAAGLAAIRYAEGTDSDAGYRALFGYHPRRNPDAVFVSFADHPHIARWSSFGWTTAAGAYQIMARSEIPQGGGYTKVDTWGDVQRALALPDFSPASQDVAAVFLIRRRGALEDLRAGRLEAALAKMGREWASLPGSPYGQPMRTYEQVALAYSSAGGNIT